jgi:hypothetical protein
MPLLLYISTVREYGRFRSNWVSFSLTALSGAVNQARAFGLTGGPIYAELRVDSHGVLARSAMFELAACGGTMSNRPRGLAGQFSGLSGRRSPADTTRSVTPLIP